MIENQKDFQTVIPCLVSLNCKEQPAQSTLALKVTETEIKMTIYRNFKQMEAVNFNYTEYKTLTVYFTHFIFENDKDSASFYFFDNPNDLKRFFYAFADASLLVAKSNYFQKGNENIEKSVFRILPKHCFIPDGKYGFAGRSLMGNYFAIVRSQLNQIVLGCHPKFSRYLKEVFPVVNSKEKNMIKKWESQNRKICIGKFSPTAQQKLLNALFVKNSKKTDELKDNYTDLSRYAESQSIDQIDQDFESFNSEDEPYINQKSFSDDISDDASYICKKHFTDTNIKYNENDYKFVLRFLLLLRDCDQTSDLIRGSITPRQSFFGSYLPKEFKERNYSKKLVYVMYSHVMEYLSQGIESVLEYTSTKVLEMLKVTSSAYALCASKSITSIDWLKSDITSLFSDTFCSPWPIWIKFLMYSDVSKTLISIIAAIIYSISPQLLEIEISDQNTLNRYWSSLKNDRKEDVDWLIEIVDLASYYYDHF